MGGRCNGGAFVHAFFEQQMWGTCRDCIHRNYSEEEGRIECAAVEGIEPPSECPELQDHIRFNGIRLYGVNK